MIIKVKNIGNLSDNYTILFQSDIFTEENVQIANNKVFLNSGENKSLIVTIKIPKKMKLGIYQIEFYIKSNMVEDEDLLTINVKPKDKRIEDTMSVIILSISTLIIIIILILLFLLLFRKKRKKAGLFPKTKEIS